ncbi:MAG TPA: hypothetical protein VMU60_12420 [Syntrophobacteria bacterium]|nr:hypothetical protein [Syntrophobacteria bacterium]
MKRRMQHFFHPLHLWCTCGGKWIRCFRLYERWLWQPYLRGLLIENRKTGREESSVSLVAAPEGE